MPRPPVACRQTQRDGGESHQGGIPRHDRPSAAVLVARALDPACAGATQPLRTHTALTSSRPRQITTDDDSPDP